MHLKHVFATAALCTLYLGATTQPVNNLKTLDSRARFGGDEPEGPAPVRGEPGTPASGAGAGKGSSNWGQALTFQAPASFTKDSPNKKGSYLTQGRAVQADLAAAHGPDSGVAVVANYPAYIKSYRVDEGTSVPSEDDFLDGLKGPFSALNIDGSTEWNSANIFAGARDPIHTGYYSGSEKAAIMADLNNNRYGPSIKKENRVVQSQILFEEYSKAAGGDVSSLRWVLRSEIVNQDTQAIMRDAQTATKGSVQDDTQVTFSATAAEGSAEKASFDALAGTDNGRMVFKMLTDNHEAMKGKTVIACHTWISDGEDYNMVWELSS